MEKSVLLRKILFFSVLCLLLFPVVYLPFFVPLRLGEWDPFFLQVCQGALIQSTLSTFLTLFFGVAGCLGLFALEQRVPPKLFQVLQLSLLVPGFVPPIIVVALVTKVLGYLPAKLPGVVFFHVIMNMGLVTLLFYRLNLRKAGVWVRQARLYNVSLVKFLFKALLPEFRFQFRWWIFYFFILYFFSFSVPFLVGGTYFGGIEVFIYEKVLFMGRWSEALQYSLLLFCALFLISRVVKEPQTRGTIRLESSLDKSYMSVPYLAVFTLFPIGLLLSGLIFSFFTDFLGGGVWNHWNEIRGTLIVGLSVGLLVFFFLSLLTYSYEVGRLEQWLLALVHPGWVFVGFSFLLVGGVGAGVDFLKIAISLAIVYLPFLYRLQFNQRLQSLSQQVRVARTFDVPWRKVFWQVLWPQCLSMIALMSGVAALWACGDFAITGLLSQNEGVTTLAYEMKILISNYRLEQAIFLLWPLLVTSTVVFFAFQGIVYVSGKKTYS